MPEQGRSGARAPGRRGMTDANTRDELAVRATRDDGAPFLVQLESAGPRVRDGFPDAREELRADQRERRSMRVDGDAESLLGLRAIVRTGARSTTAETTSGQPCGQLGEAFDSLQGDHPRVVERERARSCSRLTCQSRFLELLAAGCLVLPVLAGSNALQLEPAENDRPPGTFRTEASALHAAVESLLAQVVLSLESGDRDVAVAALEEAVSLIEHSGAPALAKLEVLARVERGAKLLERMEILLRTHELSLDAAERMASANPAFDPVVAMSREILADTKLARRDFHGAAELYRQVVRQFARARPSTDAEVVEQSNVRNKLATCEWESGRAEEAHDLWEQALDSLEQVLPPDHADLVRLRDQLGVAKTTLGLLTEARRLQESVLASRERALLPAQPDHPLLILARRHLARTLRMLGDLNRAQQLNVAVVLSCERRHLPIEPDHRDLLHAWAELGTTLHRRGELTRAHALLTAAREGHERRLHASSLASASITADLLDVSLRLAGVEHSLGDWEGARELLESALTEYESLSSTGHTVEAALMEVRQG